MHELVSEQLALLFGRFRICVLLFDAATFHVLSGARDRAATEFAVRHGVGGQRFSGVRQLLTDSLILAISGADSAYYMPTKVWLVSCPVLPEYSFPFLPLRRISISTNPYCSSFSVHPCYPPGVFFGLFPVFAMARPEISQVMQSNKTSKIAGLSQRKAFSRGAHLPGQIGPDLLLMTAAAQPSMSFLHMMRIPLG